MKSVQFFISVLVLTTTTVMIAQTDREDIENEINEQVWRLFKRSYEARDYTTFNSIHTDNILRVNDGGIKIGDAYKDRNKKWQPLKDDKKIQIDFSFEARQYHGDTAYEVGYYRVIRSLKEMPVDSAYGRFHVVLKKVDGIWKIAQDFDTGRINEIEIDVGFFDGGRLLRFGN